MCPMDHAAAIIPLILTEEANPVADLKISDTRRKVDIMGHQEGLAAGQAHNETLMTTPLGVVTEQAYHFPFSLDLQPTLLLFKRLTELRIIRRYRKRYTQRQYKRGKHSADKQ